MNKKVYILLSTIPMVISGCSENDNHEHTFSNDWSSNQTSHWHAATCGHDVKNETGDHVDSNKDYRCDICDYDLSINPEFHGKIFRFEDNIISFEDNKILIDESTSSKILNILDENPSKIQDFFDVLYSIVVKNYFEQTETFVFGGQEIELGKSQMDEIKRDAQMKVDSDKQVAQYIATYNKTSFAFEFNSILAAKGAKNESELKDIYLKELMQEKFDENIFKYHIEDIKQGDRNVKTTGERQLWNGYFKDMVPYHLSHIYVRLSNLSNNYANAIISEENAEKLYTIVDALKSNKKFSNIAYDKSDDEASAENYGDLGIMDYSAGYINEFKLGIYAYENFLNKADIKNQVIESNICIPGNSPTGVTGIAKDFQEASINAFGSEIPDIDFQIFKDLHDAKAVEKDVCGSAVINDSPTFYPRNIIFNRYINRHSAALITTTDPSLVLSSGDTNSESGFVYYNNLNKNVLSVKTATGWSPVLCVCGGSNGINEGIFFMVVNRSPFVVDQKVSLSEYFTTYYPEQSNYPVDEYGAPKKTYVNFVSSMPSETKSRADNLLRTLKYFNQKALQKYIFVRYFTFEQMTLVNGEIASLLTKWFDDEYENEEQEKENNWKRTWTNYIDMLREQNAERSKLVSDACRIAYLNGNGLDENRAKVELTEELITKMAKAMIKAGEIKVNGQLVKNENNQEAISEARKLIKGIRIGNQLLEDQISEIADLFNKQGALCNDGKEHI